MDSMDIVPYASRYGNNNIRMSAIYTFFKKLQWPNIKEFNWNATWLIVWN